MRSTATRLGVAVSSGLVLMAQTLLAQSQDGGVSEALESIFIPPMQDAPFTCILHTEWVKTMADGGTLTLVDRRRIARQADGRFYQERWVLVPKNGPLESRMSHIQIADPNAHTLETCARGINVCKVTFYGGKTTAVYRLEEQASGSLGNGTGAVTMSLSAKMSLSASKRQVPASLTLSTRGLPGTIARSLSSASSGSRPAWGSIWFRRSPIRGSARRPST